MRLASLYSHLQEFAGWTRTLENPFSVLQAIVLRRPVELRFPNGFQLKFPAQKAIVVREILRLAYPHGVEFDGPQSDRPFAWRIDAASDILTIPSGLKFGLESLDAIIFSETFVYDSHFVDFDLTDRWVVDVGANVGDTSLYYAARGARVIALEPDPTNFRRLQRNLALNPEFHKRIFPVQAALGADAFVDFKSGLNGESGIYSEGGLQTRVPSLSLGTVFERFPIGGRIILKMDCKGCEFEVVKQPEMDRIEETLIEYSPYGGPEVLESVTSHLKSAGFREFRVFRQNVGYVSLSSQGTLHARKFV
jgi:FkbM family methyltransferase